MKVWRKSKRSANYNCVEVAPGFDAVYLRDSKHPHGPIFEFSPDQWAAILSGIKHGKFDG
jgi:hypothetical protein